MYNHGEISATIIICYQTARVRFYTDVNKIILRSLNNKLNTKSRPKLQHNIYVLFVHK